jgi:hypothetical protein
MEDAGNRFLNNCGIVFVQVEPKMPYTPIGDFSIDYKEICSNFGIGPLNEVKFRVESDPTDGAINRGVLEIKGATMIAGENLKAILQTIKASKNVNVLKYSFQFT